MTNPGHLKVEFGPLTAEDAPNLSKIHDEPTKTINFMMSYPAILEDQVDDVATVLALVRLKEQEAAKLVGRFFASIISVPAMGTDL